MPDGSLCTASAEQIFPRDSVQRNCFELALYTTRDHDCISNRIGSGIRNCPRCRCRLATFGAPPTPSMIDRAIIMLNDHRFWGHASGPHRQVRRSHRSIHCWHGHAARRGALPRERFSPLAQNRHRSLGLTRLLSGVKQTPGSRLFARLFRSVLFPASAPRLFLVEKPL